MVKFNFDDNNAFGGSSKPSVKSAGLKIPKLTLTDVKAWVFSHKVEAICAGIVFLSVVILWQFYVIESRRISILSGDVQALLDKEKPASDLVKYQKQGAVLLTGLPNSLNENRFISQLTALAIKRKVTITSVSPPKTYDSGFFCRINTQLSCSVNSFIDALLFLNDIEGSDYALRIDSWKVLQTNTPGKLNMVIVVSSIEIMDNEKNVKPK